jgi:hypothetical protein
VLFTYANGGNEAFTASPIFNLATTALTDNIGTLGVIPIDFDGDGKTDLLRWSDTPSQNALWKSNGDGTFTQITAFNITTEKLFSSTGCHSSIVADFNGDGLVDILRVANARTDVFTSCPQPRTHVLYLSNGDGSFRSVTLPSNIALDKIERTSTSIFSPGIGTTGWNVTEGRYFYIADVRGDGLLRIVTSRHPAYSYNFMTAGGPEPTEQQLCSTTVCTRVYALNASETFTEEPTNVANRSLYRDRMDDKPWPGRANAVGDFDGDGVSDLLAANGVWLSRPDASPTRNFELAVGSGDEPCQDALDFNGDGRTDCLVAVLNAANNQLRVGVGGNLARNLNTNVATIQLLGRYRPLDFNGDGRTDLFRWMDDPTQNKVYLSDGDGNFTASTTFNLNTSANQLKQSDGTADFTFGDFLGNGSVQILRLKHSPTAGDATSNQLYVKSDPTPPDQLISVISPTGLKTTLTYATLANAPAGRYASDRGVSGQAAAYPLVDLTLASPVVITSETDIGVGLNKVKTEFAYKGLKAALDGRGMLGFRQSVQQNTAPNGDALSVFTDYLLDEPYAGVARRSETRRGAWNAPTAQLLSTTANTYCDRTSATNPDMATDAIPCATSAKVRRPYLRKSVEQGSDLTGSALPTVTTVNTYNDYGDPTQIVVTTEATFAGSNRQYIKSVVNELCAPDSASCPNKTAGDNWILGRLTRSTVTNTVPNLLSTLAASAGDAPSATAIAGSAPQPALSLTNCSSTTLTTTPTAATMSCTLSNSGSAAAGSISYSTAAGTTVSGPTGACAAGATCGTATVTTAATAGTYSGTLTATPNTGTATSQPISLVVNAPPALSLSSCSSTTPTTSPTAATMTCTLSNTGQSALSSISYSTAMGTTATGPTGACAANATCGTVTVTTATSAGTYSGTLTATPNAGTAASTAVSMVVNPAPTPPALALSSCSSTTPTTSPTAATMSCTLSNTGQTAASSIIYSTAAGTTASGPTGVCAANATCGTVIVTTATSAGTYSGTLTATPNAGTAASTAVSMVVNPAPTPPALALSSCSSTSPTTSPAAATMSCTLSNTGQTAASSISYATAAGTTVTGPTGACAAGATCGTATVTTAVTAGTYSGTLTATPNTGTASSQPISLVVNTPATPPGLSLSSCSSSTPTTSPTAATMSCTLSNTGQTAVSSISYSTALGTTASGPTGACAANAPCGPVTVTTATSAGTYSGTLTATPNSGTAASQPINLVVNAPPALSLSNCSSTTPTMSPTPATMSCTLSNTGQTAASSISYATAAGTTVSGPTGACAAGATCGTASVTTPATAGTYSGTLTATPNTGTATSQPISLVVNAPPALSLSNCSSTTPTTSPTAATMSCTLSNTGQTALSSISYATAAGTTVSGPTGACAAGAICGAATVTSAATAGSYSGTLTATPNTGAAASQPISLVVNAPPALSLSNCSSTTLTTSPTAATMTCSLSNSGQTAASSISYSTALGTSASGPTGACAAGATCGTVTVTSATSAGTYSGTLTATPNTGTAASQPISLVVNAPPAMSLSSCSSSSPTTSPTPATMSCTLSNTGQTTATSISYATAAGTTVSGPTGACAAGATCGVVTVTSAATTGTYSGTLTATPNAGSARSQAISLVVIQPPSVTSASFTAANYTNGVQSPVFNFATADATSVNASCSGARTGSSSATSGSVTMSSASGSLGTVTCTVTATNAAGAQASAGASATVVDAAAVMSISFSPSTIYTGSTSTLSYTGTSSTSYMRWSCVGAATGSFSSTIDLPRSGGATFNSTGSGGLTCTAQAYDVAGTPSPGASASLSVVTPPPPQGTFSYVGGTPASSGNYGGSYGTVTVKNIGAGTITEISAVCTLNNPPSPVSWYAQDTTTTLAPGASFTFRYYRPPGYPAGCNMRFTGTNVTNSPFTTGPN